MFVLSAVSCESGDPVIPPSKTGLYFPPNEPEPWETASLEWDTEALSNLEVFLRDSNTKAFIILIGGRIALERYYNGHDRDQLWYWASAGKTLTCATVGIAQQEGYLSILDPASNYLGEGWTSASPEQEIRIAIRNQLTMTSGLNELAFECTQPECLDFRAMAGTRWAYHNGPYTLLQSVVSNAVGIDFDSYFEDKIKEPLGMNGFWFDSEEGNRVYFSNARSMARFGLCVLADGRWNEVEIMEDGDFLRDMRTPSQDLNASYGYLWWLNGQASHMIPGLQLQLPGSFAPSAPADMYAGLGKNDQKLYIIPSLDMVVVRMGENPGEDAAAISVYDESLWEQLNAVLNR